MSTPKDIKDPLSMFRAAEVVEEELKKGEEKPGEKPPEKKDDKQPKSKESQFTELKRAKEAAEKEAERLKAELSQFEEFKPLKPIAEYIKTKEGGLDDEKVNKYIERNKEKKTKLTEYEKKLKETDMRLKEVSIDHSTEFRDDYIAPLEKEKGNFIALIAPVNNEGQIKNPKLIDSLYGRLLATDKDGKPLNSIQVKAVLTKFEEEYKKATGEDYDIPQLSQVVNQIQSVRSKTISAINAKQNWEKVREEKKKELLFQESQQHEELIKKETAGRLYVTDKVIKDFDYSSIEGVVAEDEFKDSIRENSNFLIKVLKGEDKKEYAELLTDLTKASHFDSVVSKLKETQEELRLEKLKNKSGAPGGVGSQKKEVKKPEGKPSDPLGMFRR